MRRVPSDLSLRRVYLCPPGYGVRSRPAGTAVSGRPEPRCARSSIRCSKAGRCPKRDRGPALPKGSATRWASALFLLALAFLLIGCQGKKQSPAERAEAAKALFDGATKNFHVPSAQAAGAEKARLEEQAAAAYQRLLKEYPDQSYWAAQALRNLGNVRAAQTNVDEAVRLFASVGERYPQEEFEVLQAWKSAADLLWDAKRSEESAKFCRKIVERFDGTNQPSVVRLVVKGAKSRLNH
jgi:tetratricopeptide (TPR) repeat protein